MWKFSAIFTSFLTVYKLALAEPQWVDNISAKLPAIEQDSGGTIGLYIKRLQDGSELKFHSNRPWYLSSTTKVPIAVVLLHQVDAKVISLAQELSLEERYFMDGAGTLRYQPIGTRYSVAALLERMLLHSDSTATDMLVQLIGKDELNRILRNEFHFQFGTITSLLEVRQIAYSQLHPAGADLSNLSFLELKRGADYKTRLQHFLKLTKLKASQLQLDSIAAAFEKYYELGYNSASLEEYGRFLELLVRRRLLSEDSTRYILSLMEKIVTGERRIKAGLPTNIRFAQKTGTQVRILCNMGILSNHPEWRNNLVVLSACVEKFSNRARAEKALAQIGALLGNSGLWSWQVF